MPFFPEVSIFTRSSEEWSKLLYDNREMCSKPAPIGYSVTLTTAHLIAAPIYITAFYTLYAEKSSSFRVYKRYLAIHAISNFLFELHLSVMMKPVLYLPYPMIRFTGSFNLCFVNGGITFFVFLFIIVLTCWSIIQLFYYRFKLISDSHLCSEWVKQFASFLNVIRLLLSATSMATLACLTLCVVGLFDQSTHKKKLNILDKFPEIMCTSAIVLPNSSETGIKPIHLFNLCCLFSIVLGSFLCGSCGAVSQMALKEMVQQTKTSMRTIAMHKAFLISLFCQIGVHACMLGFPILIYIVSVVFNFSGNDVGYVAIVMASMHGAMSTLAMIVFNRPLYSLASSKIKSFFTSTNVTIRDISSISILRSSQ